MDRIARFIVAHNKRVLGATALLTLLAATMLFRMSFNADITRFIAEGEETGQAFIALNEKYDTGDPINVLVTVPDGTFADGQALADLRELRMDIEALPGVASVASVLPADEALLDILFLIQQRMAEGPRPLTVDEIPEALASLPSIAIQQGLFATPMADLLISDDKKDTLLMVVPQEDGFELVSDLREYVEGGVPGDFDILISGNPVVFETVFGMMSWFLLGIPPVVVILLLVTFFANIGDRKL
ncbi:MAG: hypothetical protein PF636_08460, partial [Actinomycetota bacterium]|nr:hypothetical protein [Actinomycetota bacterium]